MSNGYYHALVTGASGGIGAALCRAQGRAGVPDIAIVPRKRTPLLHWPEGVSEEVRGTGVPVTAVCPGTVATDFAATAGVPIDAIPAVSLVSQSMQAADQSVLAAFDENTEVAIPGLGNRHG